MCSGYLGGTILDGLLKHPKAAQFEITSFVRSEEKAKNLEAIGLKAITGSLSALEDAVANATVVFNIVRLFYDSAVTRNPQANTYTGFL